MAGYQDLSEFERGVVVDAREMGHIISEVAIKFGFSRRTISRMNREYRKSCKTSNLRQHCSREKIMQERDQRSLTIIVKRDRPTRVPLLTARHEALHLDWAHQHQRWTPDDWKHSAWSDESIFQLNRVEGRVQVWRQSHESMDPTCQQMTVQAGGGSVIVWGACSWCDMGFLIRLDMTLTAGQCDIPHVRNRYRVAAGVLF
ncbi:HTH_Tnp_Tc3_2 domain-containing protein [Trichonephila clavipes]|nr:HTH_Tnp_Tc3_2 domain-containing protein [Trichonephila clavipes]